MKYFFKISHQNRYIIFWIFLQPWGKWVSQKNSAEGVKLKTFKFCYQYDRKLLQQAIQLLKCLKEQEHTFLDNYFFIFQVFQSNINNLYFNHHMMNFWMFPENNGCFMIPLAFPISLPEHKEILLPTSTDFSKENQNNPPKIFIKLNISREDLLRAGYNTKRNSWTEEEDQKLLELVKKENFNWQEIGKKIPNRNSKMCYSRYRRLGYDTKKRWSSREQKIILQMIKLQGMNWKRIAEEMPGRTARQIEQHYQFCLKPNLNKSQWSIEQDLLLIQLLQQHGTQWKAVEEAMGSRTQNQIKNRYFGRLLKISEQKSKENLNLTQMFGEKK